MTYIHGLSYQLILFFRSFGLGFLLGIVYDVFRTLRLIIAGKRFVVVSDVLYCALCTLTVFSFILAFNDGVFRAYILVACLLGWLVYYFALGVLAVRAASAIVRAVRGAAKAVFRVLTKPFKFIERKIGGVFVKAYGNFKKNIRKTGKKLKFNLKKHNHL